MQRFKQFLILLFVVNSITSVGCESDRVETEKEKTALVRVVKVKRGDIASWISATGTLAPNQESRLGPKVEGRIEKIFADEGDRVEKGQPLVKLEQDTYIIARNEAEAALKTAEAQLEKAEVDFKNTAKDYKRLSRLWEERVISEQRYDKMETDYTTAQAELRLANARVKEAKANLAMAEQNLKDTITYAPFPGFVVEKLMEEGEVSNWVTYQWDVLHLADIGMVKIECPIAETKISFLYLGKEATVEVDAYPGEIFTGKIAVINSKVDPVSRTFLIKIEIVNSDFRLKGGMFARVKIAEQEKKGVLQVPTRALLKKGDQCLVFKIEEGKAKPQPIKRGIISEGWVEVSEGLKEGETVVVEGIYALTEGTKVRIIE